MPKPMPLPDLVGRTRETAGDEVRYRFANGLTITTEGFTNSDPLRILPLGSPQAALMNHIMHFPDLVAGRRVFEPFAGSGVLGFTALTVGAAHVDFLDVNPRAATFHVVNAHQNGFSDEAFTSHVGDIATYEPPEPYDVILANPPFVPTPEGVTGVVTSNGGPDGNRFAEILLRRLERLLAPDGHALMYLFQLFRDGAPSIASWGPALVPSRTVILTRAQRRPLPLDELTNAYSELFPEARTGVARWRETLVARHGREVGLCHYVVRIGPVDGGAGWQIAEDFAERFGDAFWVPSDDAAALARARAMENLV